MKKMMIVVAVMIGAIASFGVLRAMNNEEQSRRNDLGLAQNEDHHGVPAQDVRKESSVAIQESASAQEDSQAIEGHVRDRRANPVAGIEVIADNGGPSAGPLPKAWTDKHGHFLINVMLAGTYQVYAVEKDYNSSPTSLFASGGIMPPHVVSVSVLEGQTSNIVLEKPPKSPKLIGRVVDADTNEPIVDSHITLRRVDNPDYFMKTGPSEEGNFVISVPPVAITLEVASARHKPWNYGSDGISLAPTRVDSLKLKQGESRKLEVRLRKKAF